ncbi:hypothetical protein KAFR_0L00160 [Kazachstania africana CBS 2517]|uniref:Phenazine biosynthesis protein n=1 Tax=Kazachstania africana (strain ATCC 22294 / BCRC 22015 / CBS 2517 / CECT 1963 / NBRC 1671 / NRRL Y-8276) TaxID=1071382 RepID=H2B1X3_KAZAF|nr:hypothetical protein KAFR_0L00160 [Kazachstania africana CBS 2517]CCF60623.1 hypothetical protein KAFR_0L00160 [Kazachstania africana CBS 2517]
MSLKVPFKQVDVFTNKPFKGNPVAVVSCLDISEDEITTEQLQNIAIWTNISETTFLFKPKDPSHDYKLRIFAPTNELPFAGHPTVGSCKAFMEFTGAKKSKIYQECGVGVVELSIKDDEVISFEANQTIVEDFNKEHARSFENVLGVQTITEPKLLNVGPKWLVYLVDNSDIAYNTDPNYGNLASLCKENNYTGIILGGKKVNKENEYEIRAFAGGVNVDEDPVCGSGALSFIRYLNEVYKYSSTTPIKITQGGRVNRDGRIEALIKINAEGQPSYHVGGQAVTVVDGHIIL